jgi:hypothetical protein
MYFESVLYICIALGLLMVVDGVKFTLPAYPPGYYASKKCMGLSIQSDTLVTGFFNIGRQPGSPSFRTNVWIEDSTGNRHMQKMDILGETRFSFRTFNRSMEYLFCTVNETPEGIYYKSTPMGEVELITELGYDSFDDSLAHALKVRPLESEIMNIEVAMKHIITQLDELHLEEKNLRETNEISNDRIRYLSIISLLAIIALGGFQIFYAKRYLKTKKLI